MQSDQDIYASAKVACKTDRDLLAVKESDQDGRGPGKGPRGWHNRGYLPHFDGGEIPQHLVFRLADSLPRGVLEALREQVERKYGALIDLTGSDAARVEFVRLADKYLDAGLGSCVLGDVRAARIVVAAIQHFDGVRYRLHHWCVMPNHVHVLITPDGEWSLGKIAHSWKSFSAIEINRECGLRGQLWMADYFDRYARNERHFFEIADYIVHNPVSAGLCQSPQEWEWSSARTAM
jgi:REP element-mobilizing transposase RayT